MEVVNERCCGLDVHKRTVVACLLTPGQAGRPVREVRTFSTMTGDLLKLSDWLEDAGCTHVAMESTGSYWKPVYNILEGTFELLVLNAHHIKVVPGRKTDVRDAEWIADLLRHGLVSPSFIPSRPEREMRELTRYRTSLIGERSSEVNRVHKVLEGANIKLASVASDIMGLSGRAMLAAILAGDYEPPEVARLARGKMRGKIAALEESLEGRVEDHQRFMLAAQLRHIEALDGLLEDVSAEIERRLAPLQAQIERLATIPGVSTRVAQVVMSEMGPNMGRFPSAGHLASWAGLCPGHNESAGKSRGGRTRKGSPSLRSALAQAAKAAAKSRTYLGAQYRRIAARRGANRATVAVAHSIIVMAYHMLAGNTDYIEIGSQYFDERQHDRAKARMTRRLEAMGYVVTLVPAVA
jgi:transposase